MDNSPSIQKGREQQPPPCPKEMLWAGDLGETSGKADVSLSMAGFINHCAMRNDTCGAAGAIQRSMSSMAGVCMGKSEAVGKVERSVSRKEGFMQCTMKPLSPVSPRDSLSEWVIAHFWKPVWASFLGSG